jgi:hypothetical protein
LTLLVYSKWTLVFSYQVLREVALDYIHVGNDQNFLAVEEYCLLLDVWWHALASNAFFRAVHFVQGVLAQFASQ